MEKEFYSNKNLNKYFNIDSFDINKLFINIEAVSSGSIAQIYEATYNNKKFCIKIVHPNIYLQCFYSKIFINFIVSILKLINYNVNIINIPVNFNEIYNNFIDQCNMINEYNNLSNFYNNYNTNEYIIIPEPIFANKNILIMSYEEGETIENINKSEYIKYKIILLLNLFIYDNILYKNIFHCDLHEGNWKIRKYNNFFKLIIYDFGYCQTFNYNKYLKEFLYSWMIKDIDNVIHLTFNNFIILNDYNDINKLIKISRTYFNKIIGSSINFINFFNIIITITNKFNCKIKNEPFNIFLSFMLIEKNLKKYEIIKNQSNVNFSDKHHEFNSIKESCFNIISFCNEYKIFKDMSNFHKNFIEKYSKKFNNTFAINNNNNNNNNIIILIIVIITKTKIIIMIMLFLFKIIIFNYINFFTSKTKKII